MGPSSGLPFLMDCPTGFGPAYPAPVRKLDIAGNLQIWILAINLQIEISYWLSSAEP